MRITRNGVKSVARFIVARAVSTTISLIIHKNTDPESRLDNVSVHIGAHVLGEWAGNSVKPFIDSQIDEAADFLNVLPEPIKPEALDS